MRYICKACGKKREATYLKIAGQAANTQNVWLCKDVYDRKCNQEKRAEVTAGFLAKLSPADREMAESLKADRDWLAKSREVKVEAEPRETRPKPVEETYICLCGERIGKYLFCFSCPSWKCQKEQAGNMDYPKLLWKE